MKDRFCDLKLLAGGSPDFNCVTFCTAGLGEIEALLTHVHTDMTLGFNSE